MDEILRFAITSRAWPLSVKYFLTTVLTVTVFMARIAIFGPEHIYPFLLFFPVIILVSLLFDRGNGIFSTILSALLSAYFILPPNQSLPIANPNDIIATILFLLTGLVMSFFVEALHASFINLAQAHEKISASAHARGILLRELSHRTRNDMAALNSMFMLQAHTLKDPEAQKAFSRAADRMQILSRVHQRLTSDADKVAIDSRSFITDLCDDIRLTRLAGRPIAMELSIESHEIEYQRAVAIGLIINELLTNAVKYGFPDDRSGKVSVNFDKKGELFRFRVADDGVGMTNSSGHGTGLGLDLARTLAAQLGGRLEQHSRGQGSSFEVTFPLKSS